jgi:hypothetical protein
MPKAPKKPRATPKMPAGDVAPFIEALARANPDPKTELIYASPYTLLVAVVLSAQATDAGVNKATKGLYEKASTPEAMVALGVEGLAKYIRTIGLWQSKAKNVIELSRLLIERHGGEVPDNRAALEARASLADPARAACVQGADAGMLALRGRAMVPVQAEDAGAEIVGRDKRSVIRRLSCRTKGGG